MRKPSLPRNRNSLARLVGSRIKKLRLERRWSESDLAALLGLPPSFIKNYEAGALLPKPYTLYRLALVFETSAGTLLDEPTSASQDPYLLQLVSRLEGLDARSRDAVIDFLEHFTAGLERLSPLIRRLETPEE